MSRRRNTQQRAENPAAAAGIEDPNDLYGVLGVARTATSDEIRRAYKRCALKHHPDKQDPDAPESDKLANEAAFKCVSRAYEVLSDENMRKVYDREGIRGVMAREGNGGDDDDDGGMHGFPFAGRHHGDFFGHHSFFTHRDPFDIFRQVFSAFDDDDDFFGRRGVDDPFSQIFGFSSHGRHRGGRQPEQQQQQQRRQSRHSRQPEDDHYRSHAENHARSHAGSHMAAHHRAMNPFGDLFSMMGGFGGADMMDGFGGGHMPGSRSTVTQTTIVNGQCRTRTVVRETQPDGTVTERDVTEETELPRISSRGGHHTQVFTLGGW